MNEKIKTVSETADKHLLCKKLEAAGMIISQAAHIKKEALDAALDFIVQQLKS